MRRIELTGLIFSRWRVVRYAGNRRWACICSCGTARTVQANQLLWHKSRSCGCLRDEEQSQRARRHGLSHTPVYNVWATMLARCTNKNVRGWQYYGARGITVCDRWRSFAAFYEDMGPRPSAKHSIDRIDNNGPYEPKNCRWATCHEQTANQRSNRILSYGGETKHLAAWARDLGITDAALVARLRTWDHARALTTNKAQPVKEQARTLP